MLSCSLCICFEERGGGDGKKTMKTVCGIQTIPYREMSDWDVSVPLGSELFIGP